MSCATDEVYYLVPSIRVGVDFNVDYDCKDNRASFKCIASSHRYTIAAYPVADFPSRSSGEGLRVLALWAASGAYWQTDGSHMPHLLLLQSLKLFQVDCVQSTRIAENVICLLNRVPADHC